MPSLSIPSEHTRQAGLTLPEVLITLAIVAVLISSTVPSMKSLIASQRVSSIAREIYSCFMLARSEAVKRRQAVSLCKSTDGQVCAESGNNWETGWLIFTDADSDGVLETGDQLIKTFGALPAGVTLIWNQGLSAGYNSLGLARLAGSFVLCESTASGVDARELVLSLTGRLRVAERTGC